jgi:AGZA family xanthine/uracil permease-like MFS transporter
MTSIFKKLFEKDQEAAIAVEKHDEKNVADPAHTMGFWASALRAEVPMMKPATSETYGGGFFGDGFAHIDNFFRATDRGSSILTEFIGGITTFFSMCYILALNGIIISNTGISKNASFFSTALSSGIFTTMMGLVVNIPVALAPGMGLNGYFNTLAATCYQNPTGDTTKFQCPTWGKTTLPWNDAMGAVMVSGLIYLIFTVTGLRSMLFRAVPVSLRAAISVGIGFFITMIGLKIGQLTRITLADFAIDSPYLLRASGGCLGVDQFLFDYGTCTSVDLNFSWYDNGMVDFNHNPPARIAALGLVLVAMFETLKLRGGIVLAIALATLIGINYPASSKSLDGSGVTDLSLWNQRPDKIPWVVDINDITSGLLTFKYGNTPIFWEAVFTFLFVELFDSFGTLTGIMTRAGYMKADPESAMTRVNRAMLVDGFGLVLGAVIGSNSITCFVESNTGIEAGARTGLASIVTGACFFLCLCFMFPFVAIIPDAATTCALVMVGVYSLAGIQEVNYGDFIDLLSAFLTIATMGFTYSIANGISVGFIFYSFLKIVRWVQYKLASHFDVMSKYGPAEGLDVSLPHPLMILMTVFMCLYFKYLGHININANS